MLILNKMLWLSIILTIILCLSVCFLLSLFQKKRKHNKEEIKRFKDRFKGRFAKLKMIFVFYFIIMFIGAAFFACYNLSNRIAFIRFVSGSYQFKNSNGEKYLVVKAEDHYSLGYLIGQALSSKILEMKTLLMGQSILIGKNYFNDAIICTTNLN